MDWMEISSKRKEGKISHEEFMELSKQWQDEKMLEIKKRGPCKKLEHKGICYD